MSRGIVGIIGAGGLAREVYAITKQAKLDKEFIFIDHLATESSLSVCGDDVEVIREEDILSQKYHNITLICAIGEPRLRSKVWDKFQKYNFVGLTHPSALISGIEKQKLGNIYTAGVISTVNITVGVNNYFNLGVTLGHDAIVGNHNVFNPGVNISGGVKIGDRCLFGTGAQVLQDLTICSDVIIGAGALVTKDIDEPGTYVGIPAKKFR